MEQTVAYKLLDKLKQDTKSGKIKDLEIDYIDLEPTKLYGNCSIHATWTIV